MLPGGTVTLIARVEQSELTMLGAGREETILSVSGGPGTSASPRGIVTSLETVLRVESIGFENLRNGVTANGPAVMVEDCGFRYNYRGLDSWAPDSTRVLDSSFLDNSDRGIIIFQNLGAKNVLIEACTFEEGGAEIDLQSQSSIVRNCTFTRPGVGLQTSLGGEAQVENCRFTGAYNWGVALLNGSSMELLSCRFRSSDGGDVTVSNGSHLVGSGNVLGGGVHFTLSILLSTTIDFHGNHILNGGGFSVDLGGSPPTTRVIDLTNNYWGTTDPAQIDAWILDKNDNPAINGVVEYEPFAQEPIAAQAKSFSEFKSFFSDGN